MLRLVPPQDSNYWTVQGKLSKLKHRKLHGMFGKLSFMADVAKDQRLTDFKAANPFFQCGTDYESEKGHVMVEFWTLDEASVKAAAAAVSYWLGVAIK